MTSVFVCLEGLIWARGVWLYVVSGKMKIESSDRKGEPLMMVYGNDKESGGRDLTENGSL